MIASFEKSRAGVGGNLLLCATYLLSPYLIEKCPTSDPAVLHTQYI